VRARSRLIGAVILVALAAIGVFYYATTNVISQAFTTIETQSISKNTDRAVQALDSQVDQLQSKVEDWSDWDDTYAFVENHNQTYITSNLQPSALTQLSIDTMLFYNQAGKLVFGESVDPTSGNAVPTSPELLKSFSPGSSLMATTVNSQSKGILAYPDTAYQFVSLPILTSAGYGPPHGTLVFALQLTPSEVATLSTETQLKLQFFELSSPSLPKAVTATIGAHPKSGAITIDRVNAKEAVGYEVVSDVYGHSALVASATQARTIHDVADSALVRFLFVVLLDTLAAIGVSAMLLEIIRRRDRTIALKNEFFSIASHELRTPLTVIRDYAQLMKFQFSKQVADPKFDHMVDNIDQTGAQLIGLVNVFLDAARMEQGKIPFEVKAFSVIPVITGIQPEIVATAHKKGLAFTVDLPVSLPMAMGDEARVRQVILNVIGNSMKFTDAGSVTLKSEVKGKFLMVYVNDTGRGMDLPAQRVLFQRFSQVRSGDARLGSGLGLFISKKLIEQMGGTIQVESSAPGIGTSISFSLPLAPPNAQTLPADSGPTATGTGGPPITPGTPAQPTSQPPPTAG